MKKIVVMLSVFSLLGAALLVSPVAVAAPAVPQLSAHHDAVVQIAKKGKKSGKKSGKKKSAKKPTAPVT